MAMLPNVFNSEGKEKMGFSVLPAGWYEAEIVKSEVKDTKAGTGKYLMLQFKIINHDEYNGRFIFTNLNLVNPNQTAVQIAEKELATICDACGTNVIEDSAELHDIPLGVKLTVKAETAQWPAKNEIKGYCHINDIPQSESNGDDSPF